MVKLDLSIFPVLETERLVLRRLEMTDANEIYLLRSDKSVNEFIDREPSKTIEEAEQFIQKIMKGINNNESIYWAIAKKDDPKLIGTISCWNLRKEERIAEVGYELMPAYQGRGFMLEVLTKVVDYVFNELKLACIDAYMMPGNVHSSKLLEKLGFKRVPSPSNDPENKEISYALDNPNK